MQVSPLPAAAAAVAPRHLMHVYNDDWLRAMLPSKRCSGQMFCAEDLLPQAILKSELLAPTPAAACLHVVPLRFSERSQGKWQGEPKRIYLNESRTMVDGIMQRTPWYTNSGGRDHIWILACCRSTARSTGARSPCACRAAPSVTSNRCSARSRARTSLHCAPTRRSCARCCRRSRRDSPRRSSRRRCRSTRPRCTAVIRESAPEDAQSRTPFIHTWRSFQVIRIRRRLPSS